MRNHFRSTPDLWPGAESEAAELFSPLARCELSPYGSALIRGRVLAALSATANVATMPRTRFAVASAAVAGPLLAVGAVSAAAGTSPIEAPVEFLESAVSVVSIGGNSGEVRQDADHRNEASSNFGQPGSQPGNTANAAVAASATPSPTGTATAAPSPAAAPTGTATQKPSPHENGKGCDDVLFANGEPPFASPGGPVGCEVGNSGAHRKNGATPEASPTGTATPTATPDGEEEEDANGGTSRGLGNGHAEDKPGNGNGNGHTKHDHDPNPNGNGPGGPNAATPAPSGTPQPVATTAAGPAGGATKPGNGNGNGGNGNGGSNGSGNGKNK